MKRSDLTAESDVAGVSQYEARKFDFLVFRNYVFGIQCVWFFNKNIFINIHVCGFFSNNLKTYKKLIFK